MFFDMVKVKSLKRSIILFLAGLFVVLQFSVPVRAEWLEWRSTQIGGHQAMIREKVHDSSEIQRQIIVFGNIEIRRHTRSNEILGVIGDYVRTSDNIGIPTINDRPDYAPDIINHDGYSSCRFGITSHPEYPIGLYWAPSEGTESTNRGVTYRSYEAWRVSCTIPPNVAVPTVLGLEDYPCDDEELQTTYDTSSYNYHHYKIVNEICSLSIAGCTSDFVFSTMISQVRFIAPTTEVTTPVINCQVNDLNIYGPWGVDSIRTTVNPDNRSITNYTRPDHILHPGKVTRTVTEEDSSIYVVTIGEGDGKGPDFNEFFASGTWFTEGFNDVDRLLIEEVNRRLPQLEIPSNQ